MCCAHPRSRHVRATRIQAHPRRSAHRSPLQTAERYFRRVRNQLTLSTGMTAIAFAREMCGEVRAPRDLPTDLVGGHVGGRMDDRMDGFVDGSLMTMIGGLIDDLFDDLLRACGTDQWSA